RKPQDGKINIEYKNKKYDLRVSIVPVINGEKIVIRILYGENFSYTLESLGFTEEKIKIIKKIISVKNGIVIICGPTGSGKSSTLYTILKELDSKTLNITTLEDPVEIQMQNINQINLNKKLGITFASGLRSILRQDPDVIMIGEIRDEETAQIAVSSSITGHKVYSTIHCKSPKEVFMRLENMGVKPYLIKEGLVGVISQRLVKILCRKCKCVDEEKTFKGHKVFKAVGCDSCKFTGYEGRKVVSSVWFLNSSMNYNYKYNDDEEFLSNKSMKNDMESLLMNGMISYNDYLEFIEGERLDE
ncbi:MAG: GspE/PulE family protein, partial [Clostridium sp.]